MAARVAVCVFAKPPRPGQVKTRLAAELGNEAAAHLAEAFLRDTWAMVKSLPWAQPVLAATETTSQLLTLAAGDPLWVQGPGDLGAKLESIAERALAAGFGAVLEIGADSPGLPVGNLQAASDALANHEAVLGPSDDGGFYVLGLTQVVHEMLSDLPWSQPNTAAQTQARLQSLGMRVASAPAWFDVDDVNDLRRLKTLIAEGRIQAPHTTAALTQVALGGNA